MTRMVNCKKLGKKAPAIDYQPYPGELGKKIYENISAQAWDDWISHQTMLINEYKLNMLDDKAREFLEKEMQKFLFGGKSEKPSGYTDPNS